VKRDRKQELRDALSESVCNDDDTLLKTKPSAGAKSVHGDGHTVRSSQRSLLFLPPRGLRQTIIVVAVLDLGNEEAQILKIKFKFQTRRSSPSARDRRYRTFFCLFLSPNGCATTAYNDESRRLDNDHTDKACRTSICLPAKQQVVCYS
jgi:hypothetical protein